MRIFLYKFIPVDRFYNVFLICFVFFYHKNLKEFLSFMFGMPLRCRSIPCYEWVSPVTKNLLKMKSKFSIWCSSILKLMGTRTMNFRKTLDEKGGKRCSTHAWENSKFTHSLAVHAGKTGDFKNSNILTHALTIIHRCDCINEFTNQIFQIQF